tara:strand:+ start:921 stop:2402 length:1482 start_codon:yes stop_codon:yes gene_type:complete
MNINYFILFIIAISISFTQEELVIREYVENGDLDILINNYNSQIYLVQLDAINDSLYNLALSAIPDLGLHGGPSSYQRLMYENDLNRLTEKISSEYLHVLNDNYILPDNRDYWALTLQGNQYSGTSGETSSTCMCIDSSDCLVVGFNDSWYNPFDYYGEATWSFNPPASDEILEVRIYIAGAQCDDLPLWSETEMSIKNNDCQWSDFQATLSTEYTVNGPYIIPDELLEQIWCGGSLQPVIGSEDNYNIDWIQMEIYYVCEEPIEPENVQASYDTYCDYIQIDWSVENDIDGYNLYRDGDFITSFSSENNQYLDYFATQDQEHEYCITSFNNCGESLPTCSTGMRGNGPNTTNSIAASENFIDYINISWESTLNTNYYNLYRDNFLLSVLAQDILTYSDTFVDNDVFYEYCIESVNDCGESDWNCDTGSLAIGSIGDVNLDQIIDILDIVIILNFVLELEIPNEEELWLADMNQDGDINILDVVLLVNLILYN